MGENANDGAVAFQLGKVFLDLLLPGFVRPLHRRLRERLLLRPVPEGTRWP